MMILRSILSLFLATAVSGFGVGGPLGVHRTCLSVVDDSFSSDLQHQEDVIDQVEQQEEEDLAFVEESLELQSSLLDQVNKPTSALFPKTEEAVSDDITKEVHLIQCENKFYQLEEREDQECITTEVFLRPDGKIDFGDTDGPMPLETEGHWNAQGADGKAYSMTIRRTFATGRSGSDMGEFQYQTLRTFTGDMDMVGDCVGITGVMLSNDEVVGDEEVGFFNMIDSTNERDSYGLDSRLSFKVDTTKGLRLSELPTEEIEQVVETSKRKKLWRLLSRVVDTTKGLRLRELTTEDNMTNETDQVVKTSKRKKLWRSVSKIWRRS